MFKFQVRNECHARTKNGQPPHSTTGLASAAWSQPAPAAQLAKRGAKNSLIVARSNGRVSATPTQKRNVIERSSLSSASSSETLRGSSAMPQMGQLPGRSRRISGCIGQVYIAPAGSWDGEGGFGFRYCSGFAANRSLHPLLQKKYFCPRCSTERSALAATLIPHTGSISLRAIVESASSR